MKPGLLRACSSWEMELGLYTSGNGSRGAVDKTSLGLTILPSHLPFLVVSRYCP